MQLNKRAARRRWRGGGDPVESTEEEAIFGYAYGWYVCRRQVNVDAINRDIAFNIFRSLRKISRAVN